MVEIDDDGMSTRKIFETHGEGDLGFHFLTSIEGRDDVREKKSCGPYLTVLTRPATFF